MSLLEVKAMDDEWFSEQDANDDYLYGKDLDDTYPEPDKLDWISKGW